MKATYTRRRRTAVRAGFAGLALALGMFSAGSGAVLAAGAPGGPPLPPVVTPPDPGAPGAPPGTTESPGTAPSPGSDPAPAGQPAQPAQPAGEHDPAAPEQTEPEGLFPEETGPAPNVSNISMTGEAHVVRQDLTVPLELLLGRYPRATTEVSRDLTTAFAAYADPGFLGRFGAQSGLGAAGDRNVSEPAWAECVFPMSPLTPTEDLRSPGQGAGPTAGVKCLQGAAGAAGYFARDPGAGSTGGVAVFQAGSGSARVDATSNAAGATATVSSSSLDHVNLAEAVKIASITNVVSVRTNGRPGGAIVETSATIGGLTISGVPVELPSDSLADLGPVLAQLPPVLTPIGVMTFDVIPEQKEAAADGTSGTGRAAQLLVTLENGESTVSFGVGFASARGRTILSEFTPPGGSRPVPPFRPVITTGAPLRPANPGARGFVDSFTASLGGRPGASAGRSGPVGGATIPGPFGGNGRSVAPPATGLNLLPPQPGTAQNAGETEPWGGDGPWIAVIGGSVIALGLARYLAYSTAVRPTAA